MGGMNSGNWFRNGTKTPVEDCRTLCVNRLAKDGMLRAGAKGVSVWSNLFTGKRIASVGLVVSTSGDNRTLHVFYRVNDSEDVLIPIRLQTTRPNYGGVRWWFTCPLIVAGVPCNRRVGTLHLYGRYFGCRTCYDLTYRSCQRTRNPKYTIASLFSDWT